MLNLKPAVLTITLLLSAASCGKVDPLPSWNEGATKQAILRFVQQVTDRSSPTFVAPADRIATFDNDGTLWVEQPIYVNVLFAAAQMKAQAPRHTEWSANPAFQTIANGDDSAISTLPQTDWFVISFAVHAGLTTEEFAAAATQWLATHKHPRFQKPYTELVYQPMLELIAYLRGNEFQVYTVTGSELDFVRVVNEQAFGIPRDHVIATVLKTKFDSTAKPAALLAVPEPLLIDDSDGKPISIHNVVGRRPIAAFGNSDGDLSMLQYAASAPGARLALLVHHDDAVREFAYDRTSAIGKLDKALDAAAEQHWTVVSMKSDWKTIFR